MLTNLFVRLFDLVLRLLLKLGAQLPVQDESGYHITGKWECGPLHLNIVHECDEMDRQVAETYLRLGKWLFVAAYIDQTEGDRTLGRSLNEHKASYTLAKLPPVAKAFTFDAAHSWLIEWVDEDSLPRVTMATSLDHLAWGEGVIKGKACWTYRYTQPLLPYLRSEKDAKLAQDHAARLWFVKFEYDAVPGYLVTHYAELKHHLEGLQASGHTINTCLSMSDYLLVQDTVPEPDPADVLF